MQGFCAASNVVGYQQVVIPAQQFTMIGVMYADMTNGAISVQELFHDPLGQGLTGAATQANADQLMYWDPNEDGSYVTLYLNSNTGTTSILLARKNKWCTTAIQKDESWGGRNVASPKKLASGTGLWLKRYNYASSITLTMSGSAVVAQDGRNIAIREGFTMISGGFSAPFVPNPDVADPENGVAIDWLAKGCKGAATQANADQLMFWDTNEDGSYVTLYLNSNTGTTSTLIARKNHWCTTAIQKDESWGGRNVASPKVIPAGRGVWYKRLSGEGAFTLTLDQPYSL